MCDRGKCLGAGVPIGVAPFPVALLADAIVADQRLWADLRTSAGTAENLHRLEGDELAIGV
jgi:hypothetical protein